ncbi:uncharacterized protein Bfra_008781 [Botrytis fragariae]|uniref:Uncharacterized protein n=1 Tax=Botrytis fragariae TaxID=1964551 RepID=A0A8H6EGT0_9HELO|nr:uncharacterized protein Bfra_008781 [Botrytis fragariae]KAF5871757.1 hypothetical protein Bfra_008781 [Botrytis fragariae]
MDVQIFLKVLCDKGTRPPFNYSERYIRNTFFVYIEEGNRLEGASLEQEAEAVSLWTWEDLFGKEPYPEPTWLAKRGRRSSGPKLEKKTGMPSSVAVPRNPSWMSRVEVLKTGMGVWHYLGLVSMGVLLGGISRSSRVRGFVGQWVNWGFVYKSVYNLMLSKAISYGYVEQQVLAILTESHDRVELSMFKNIPDAERYWMAERWTWETLFADELAEFPGEKPEWKRVTNYLKHKSPVAGETPENAQVEASDSSTSPNPKLRNCLATRPQILGDKTSEVKASVPKRIICVDASPEVSSGKQAPKSATKLPSTSPTSSPSERESNKRQKLIENSELANKKDPNLPGGISTTDSPLTDRKR